MRGRGRGMVRGERWRGGSVKKSEDERGRRGWSRNVDQGQPKRERAGAGGGGFIRSGH